MVDLSIIIINYNTFDLTCDCIRSVIEQTKTVTYEILLIDNASKNDPEEFKQLFPQIHLYKLKENVGFGCANNFGMERCNGRYILLLNSDTIVLDKALDKCIAHFDKINDPKVGAIGCKVLNADKSYQLSAYPKNKDHQLSGLLRKLWHGNPLVKLLRTDSNDYLDDEQRTLKNKNNLGGLYGCFVLLKKEVYEKTKGFDPDFFMYCEETNWFRKHITVHYKVQYYEEASIIHLVGGSDQSGIMVKQTHLSYYLYWLKFSHLHFWIFFLVNWFNLISGIFLLPIMKKKNAMDHLYLLKIHLNLLPYTALDIPWKKIKHGSRKKFLILKSLDKVRLGNIRKDRSN